MKRYQLSLVISVSYLLVFLSLIKDTGTASYIISCPPILAYCSDWPYPTPAQIISWPPRTAGWTAPGSPRTHPSASYSSALFYTDSNWTTSFCTDTDISLCNVHLLSMRPLHCTTWHSCHRHSPQHWRPGHAVGQEHLCRLSSGQFHGDSSSPPYEARILLLLIGWMLVSISSHILLILMGNPFFFPSMTMFLNVSVLHLQLKCMSISVCISNSSHNTSH